MKKRYVISVITVLFIALSFFVYNKLSNINNYKDNNKLISMYLLDQENGNILSVVNTIEKNYLLDTSRTECTGTTGVTGTVTLANQKLNLHADGSVKCSVYFYEEKAPIYCVDESGDEISCPQTFTMGDRIAIGKDTPQYFRYLRTTDTSQKLSECGTTSSVDCADSTNGVHRFLAEYNLKRTGDASSGTAIASDALQDPSESAKTNTVQYGASNSDYNQSYLKTYMTNYQNVLNTMIGEANAVTVNTMTLAEIRSFSWGCPASSYGTCSSIPTWAKNSRYWLGSAYDTIYVWRVIDDGTLSYTGYSNNANFGARAVVNIPSSYFN